MRKPIANFLMHTGETCMFFLIVFCTAFITAKLVRKETLLPCEQWVLITVFFVGLGLIITGWIIREKK